jgi:hypothetical protein
LERIPLEVRLAETRAALARWQVTIRDRCPGEHRYVQHVAWKLPWCDACGYTDAGLHRSELGAAAYSHDPDDEDDLDDVEED